MVDEPRVQVFDHTTGEYREVDRDSVSCSGFPRPTSKPSPRDAFWRGFVRGAWQGLYVSGFGALIAAAITDDAAVGGVGFFALVVGTLIREISEGDARGR